MQIIIAKKDKPAIKITKKDKFEAFIEKRKRLGIVCSSEIDDILSKFSQENILAAASIIKYVTRQLKVK